jgi:PAS domain S-box-containing protein/putative nucleotidyltransferase with HDIG domain
MLDITGRKQAETALQESQQILRSVLDTIIVRVFWKDLDLNFLGYNQPFAADTGINSPEELIGKNDYQMNWKEQAELYRADDRSVIDSGKAKLNYEEPQLMPNGRIRWLRTSKVPLLGADGQMRGVLGTYEDITDQKQIEIALRESEEKFRNIIEQASDGFLLVDEQGIILEWNHAQEHMSGLKKNDVIGRPFWEVQFQVTSPERQSPERLEYYRSVLLTALQTGESPVFKGPIEATMLGQDGKRRTIEQIAFPVKTDRGYRLGSFTRDVTERKLAEVALKDSEASYRGLFNTVTDSIYIQDRDGRFVDVNEGAARMYGFPREFLIGKTPLDLSAPGRNDLEKVRQQVENAFGGEPQQFEFWGRRSNGEIFPKEVRLSKGTYFGQDVVIAMAQDITARKQAEGALQRKLRELTILHATALAGAQSASVDDLIEGITNIFVENLPSDYFGMLLLNPDTGLLVTHPSLHGMFENGRPGPIPLGQGVTGTVAATGVPRLIPDVAAEPIFINVTATGTRSELCVPIVLGKRVIGVINAESKRVNFFSEDDEKLLITIAGAMATAIERIRLFEAEHTRRQEAETLQKAAVAVSSSLELSRVLEAILASLSEVVPYDSAAVILARDDEELEIVAGHGFPVGYQLIGRHFTQTERWHTLVRTHKALILEDAQADPNFTMWEGTGYIRGWMAVPLIVRETVIGYVTLDNRRSNAYTEENSVLAQAFAQQAAIAVDNARLYEQAIKATERRAILHRASQEIARVSQDPEGVYVAVHQAAEQLMPAEAFVITLLDEVNKENVAVYMVDKGGRWPIDRLPVSEGLSGLVITTGETIMVKDLAADADPVGIHFGVEEEVRSILAVPIRLGAKVIGMLSAQSYRRHVYSEDDRALLEMLAAHAAVALENARLFEQTRQRRMEAEALRDVSVALTSSLDINQVLNHLLDALAQVVSFDSATVFLYKENALLAVAVRGVPTPENILGKQFSGDDLLFRTIMKDRRSLVIPDAQTDERFQRFGGTDYVHGWMGIPMIVRNEVIGILTIDNRTPAAYTQTTAQLALAFANQAATAIENARLFAETRNRLEELEVLNRISTELRVAQNVREMLPLLLDEALKALHCNSGTVWLFDHASGLLKTQAARGWFAEITESPVKPTEGIAGSVFTTGQPFISREFASDPITRESLRRFLPPGWGGACVPIRTGQETLGVMFASVKLPRQLQQEEVHLLVTISEIAGNAIRRADLHEQTERQLKRLASLRSIDMAISTILDLRVTLGILIDHIVSQLHVDAVNILLLNSSTQLLYHAAGIGFRSDSFKNIQLFAGDSLASQVIRLRTTIYIPDLNEQKYNEKIQSLAGEGFVTYFGVPLITKGQVKGVLEVYHRSRTDPDAEWRGFLDTLSGQAAIAIDNALLFEELQQTNLNLSLAYDATIEGWSKALDLRDRETEGHTLRVTKTTLQLAELMGVGPAESVHIRRGALLHDIGKMGVPDSILFKPGPLTEAEWIIMRRHPEFAFDMLSSIAYLRQAVEIPYCHHERWDGSGYPRGLHDDQIPLSARLFAVVDVWDALTSDRPYRKAWTKEAAIDYIHKASGTHFDPRIVEAFLKTLDI